jgi:hypothetical protein
MSTNSNAGLIQRLLTLGATDFLVKPLSKHKLSSLRRFFDPQSAQPLQATASTRRTQHKAPARQLGKAAYGHELVDEGSASLTTHAATNTVVQDSSPLHSTAAGGTAPTSQLSKLAQAAVAPAQDVPSADGIVNTSTRADAPSYSSRSPTDCDTSTMCAVEGAHKALHSPAKNALCVAAAMLSAAAEVSVSLTELLFSYLVDDKPSFGHFECSRIASARNFYKDMSQDI